MRLLRFFVIIFTLLITHSVFSIELKGSFDIAGVYGESSLLRVQPWLTHEKGEYYTFYSQTEDSYFVEQNLRYNFLSSFQATAKFVSFTGDQDLLTRIGLRWIPSELKFWKNIFGELFFAVNLHPIQSDGGSFDDGLLEAEYWHGWGKVYLTGYVSATRTAGDDFWYFENQAGYNFFKEWYLTILQTWDEDAKTDVFAGVQAIWQLN